MPVRACFPHGTPCACVRVTPQVTCAVVVCAWSAMLHGVYKPFVNKSTYYLQHAALQIVFVLFVTGLLLKVRWGCRGYGGRLRCHGAHGGAHTHCCRPTSGPGPCPSRVAL